MPKKLSLSRFGGLLQSRLDLFVQSTPQQSNKIARILEKIQYKDGYMELWCADLGGWVTVMEYRIKLRNILDF